MVRLVEWVRGHQASGDRFERLVRHTDESTPVTHPSPMTARLSCGCVVGFKAGVEGSPVTVVVDRKAEGCAIHAHVAGLPVYDHREALRPSTRLGVRIQPD